MSSASGCSPASLRGQYVDVVRPTFVSFTSGWTDPAWNLPPGSSLVSVELTPVECSTRVRLTHSRLPGDLRADPGRRLDDVPRAIVGRGRRPGAGGVSIAASAMKPVVVQIAIDLPAMRPLVRRNIAHSCRRLKEMLESRPG